MLDRLEGVGQFIREGQGYWILTKEGEDPWLSFDPGYWVAGMESSLEVEKKRCQESSDVVSNVSHITEEDHKTFHWEAKTHVEALEGKVVGLQDKFHDSLQQIV